MEELEVEYEEKPNNTSKKIIAIVGVAIFIVPFIVMLCFFMSSDTQWLTYDNYCDIKNGMTYSEVVEVLDGHKGKLDTTSGYEGYTISFYTWQNSSGTKCIVVSFENGRVGGKSQYGLH